MVSEVKFVEKLNLTLNLFIRNDKNLDI